MSRQPEVTAAAGRGVTRQVPLRETQVVLRRRLVAVGSLLVVAAGLLIWRLAVVQLAEPDRFLAYGESQRIRPVELAATRGAIIDRNGVDLALSLSLPSLVANPMRVDEPRLAALRLAGILDVERPGEHARDDRCDGRLRPGRLCQNPFEAEPLVGQAVQVGR